MSSARRRMMMKVLGGGKEYIEFADPAVEAICVANWSSDGVGLTLQDAARVTSISNSIFHGNTSIVSFDELQYFTGLTTLSGGTGAAAGVFRGCTALVSITLPNTITSIQTYAFQGCSSLESIVLPSSITTIGSNAFSGCSSLGIDINLPNLTSLGQGAFYQSGVKKLSNLGSITTVPGGSTLALRCFYQCTSLTDVVLPSTVTTIQQGAFTGCSNLERITLSSNITTIGASAFYDCSKMAAEINLPNLTSLGSQAFRYSGITKILNLGTITSIPGGSQTNACFQHCSNLEYADLPSTLTALNSYCFGATALVDIIVRASTPPTLSSNVFRDTNTIVHIYVPAGTGTTYKAASGWSSYSSKIYELDSNGNIPT